MVVAMDQQRKALAFCLEQRRGVRMDIPTIERDGCKRGMVIVLFRMIREFRVANITVSFPVQIRVIKHETGPKLWPCPWSQVPQEMHQGEEAHEIVSLQVIERVLVLREGGQIHRDQFEARSPGLASNP